MVPFCDRNILGYWNLRTIKPKFPGAFSHFEHDPLSLVDILEAYRRLIYFEVIKRNMVSYLRRASSEMIRSHSENEPIQSRMSRLVRRFEKLQGVEDNN